MRDFLANIMARAGVLKGILPLNRAAAVRDALAGAQLASMDIPQVLGYARIAGRACWLVMLRRDFCCME